MTDQEPDYTVGPDNKKTYAGGTGKPDPGASVALPPGANTGVAALAAKRRAEREAKEAAAGKPDKETPADETDEQKAARKAGQKAAIKTVK